MDWKYRSPRSPRPPVVDQMTLLHRCEIKQHKHKASKKPHTQAKKPVRKVDSWAIITYWKGTRFTSARWIGNTISLVAKTPMVDQMTLLHRCEIKPYKHNTSKKPSHKSIEICEKRIEAQMMTLTAVKQRIRTKSIFEPLLPTEKERVSLPLDGLKIHFSLVAKTHTIDPETLTHR